jgi:hypothetical protein
MPPASHGCSLAQRDQIDRRNLRLFCAAVGADFELCSTRDPYQLDTCGQIWDGTAPAIRILPSGRFGNNICQLIHAFHIAKLIGSKMLYLDRANVGAIDSIWESAGLFLSPFCPAQGEMLFSGRFFSRSPFKPHFVGFDGPQLVNIATNIVAPMLRHRWRDIATAQDHVLHIHIRSADIFTGERPNSWYVPPPLAYYKKAIADFQLLVREPEIIIIAEDWNNPCIHPLYAFLLSRGFTVRNGGSDFERAVRELLSATSLITSVGTFARMIALTSNCIRRVYAFRDIPDRLSFVAKGVALALVLDPSGRYIARNSWRNAPGQVRQIIDYPETVLDIGYASQ